jgi:REP-associated tyrosine transposase
MSRPLRIEYPGAWYHVMNRGARYQDIFLNNDHYELFLKLLCELFEDYGMEVHAYCLMKNQYHLLCHTPLGNLGRSMRHLNGVYTQRFNRLENLDGPLFRGRYKAILIDADNYLQQVSRYIHRTALETGMAKKLENYDWSSYPAYLQQTKPPGWLMVNTVLGYFGGSAEHYQEYVESGLENEMQRFYAGRHLSPIMGSQSFKDRLLKTATCDVVESPELRRAIFSVPIKEIVCRVCKIYSVQNKQLHESTRGQKNEPRLIAMYLARKLAGMTYPAIAAYFDLGHYKSATSAITRVQQDKKLLRKAEWFKRKWNSTPST